jgi:hypothetical protein
MARLLGITVLFLVGILPVPVQAQDFAARFAMIDTAVHRGEAVPAMAALSGTLALRPSLPAALAGWTFDDQTFVGLGTHLERVRFSAPGCGGICDAASPSHLRATAAFGNETGFFYLTTGFTAHETQNLSVALSGTLSEKWTAGIGFTYRPANDVRLWGQFDRVEFSSDAFGTFAGVPASMTGFALKGGVSLQLKESLFGDSHGIVAADWSLTQRFLEWWRRFAPNKFMPN